MSDPNAEVSSPSSARTRTDKDTGVDAEIKSLDDRNSIDGDMDGQKSSSSPQYRQRHGDYRGSGGGRARDSGKGTSLLVRNLSFRIRSDEIKRLMSKYGDVKDVYMPLDFKSKQPRGFAFVEFYDKRDASDAQYYLDRHRLDGRDIAVVFARENRKTPDEMLKPNASNERGNSINRGRDRGRDRPSDNHGWQKRGRHNDSSRSRSRGRSARGNDRSNHRDHTPDNHRRRRSTRGSRSRSRDNDRGRGRDRYSRSRSPDASPIRDKVRSTAGDDNRAKEHSHSQSRSHERSLSNSR